MHKQWKYFNISLEFPFTFSLLASQLSDIPRHYGIIWNENLCVQSDVVCFSFT